MFPKRSTQPDDSEVLARNTRSDLTVAAESLRSSTESSKPKEKSAEENISLFWRVFGGTILSIVALVIITLFNNIMNTISELRSEVNKLGEYRTELVKKDEFNTRMNSNWERIQSIQAQNNTQNATLTAYRSEFDSIKERLARQQSQFDDSKKETALVFDTMRKDITAALDGLKRDVNSIEILKDRITAAESIKKDISSLEALKERLTSIQNDMKTSREDYLRLRQEVDKITVSESERKTRRDEQYKEYEKTLKDIQTAVQEFQVKLARLEATSAKPAARPSESEKGETLPPGKSNK